MAVLWLTTLLMPVACLLPAHEDPDPPIKNVRMEAEQRWLTWDVSGNVSDISCFKDSLKEQHAKENKYCDYPTLPLCKVTNYTVTVASPQYSTWILFPEQDKNRDAAAANLTCWVPDADVMTCSWAVGRAAPRDTQYHLYWKDIENNKNSPCPRYGDERGVHVQCRLQISKDLGISGDYDQFLMVTVNGTSRVSSISCTELLINLPDIELLRPPNITANCNKTHSFMEWSTPSYFWKTLNYELLIRQNLESVPTMVNTQENFFQLPNPGTYMVQIRASSRAGASEWGAAQRFVCDPEEDKHTHVWRTALLVVTGTLVIAVGTVLVCKRYSLLQKLLPRIPGPKDPIRDGCDGELVAWDAGREDCPVAEVQVLGER